MPLTVTTRYAVLPIMAALLLALCVVLPPKYMTPYILLLGVAAGAWGSLFRRDFLLRPPVLAILVPLVLAAVFCLVGTLPITRRSDIQLEFLKYAIYGVAFLLGLLVLGQPGQTKAFVIAVITLVFVFFIATILTSGPRFGIHQSWLLYPPDQNNSSSFLAPLSAIVLAFRPRWLKIVLLLLLFLFFTFAESRLGVLMLFAVAAADLLVDWRSGLVVLVTALAITGLFSLSPFGAQTTVMTAVTKMMSPTPEAAAPPPASGTTAKPATPQQAPRITTNRVIEFGTSSDSSRLRIYRRALEISAHVFPNFIGKGDAQVIAWLNTPPIDKFNTYRHAHNFFLQGYLSYGLLATACMVFAALGIAVVAIRQRNWYLLGALALIGTYGMIEALISDIRVLTIMMMVMGSSVATTLGRDAREHAPNP